MSESNRASVSFTTMPPGVLADSHHGSMEDIQISLAPHIQQFLSQTGRRHSCCSVMLPVAFERAAPKSWLDPKFDSAVLEGQYQSSVFPQLRLRFRFALLYILLCSVVWLIYFLSGGGPINYWIPLSTAFGLAVALCIAGLWMTYSKAYRQSTNLFTGLVAILLSGTSLLFLIFSERAFSPLGHFALCIEIILLIYTVIPLPLWQSATIATIYSILFEVFDFYYQNSFYQIDKSKTFTYKIIAIRILLQLCVHVVGIHVLIMNVVRMRGTFMKVGQNLLVRRQLEMEKQLKEKMIHSVMPPKVADMLMKEGMEPDPSQQYHDIKPRISNDVKSLFRPFHMHSMDNVSILFADIVGFTKMSSTKTAEQLVEILNDLFERFDELCTLNGCEKISTLGDCYYCVSGCPEPRPDHAICCVEMGLGMITAIRLFDAQRHEGIKMRVGVHTGTVLCGIVGTRRVKFDVWSNDVTLANRLESTGVPEQVHISQETCSFLGDGYIMEEGEELFGHRTYFVLGKKKDPTSLTGSQNDLIMPDGGGTCKLIISPPDAYDGFTNGVQLSRSATNLSTIHPSVPPASPIGATSTSLNPSPVLSSRPRLASLGKVSKYLTGVGGNQINTTALSNGKNGGTPTIIVTAKSLPGGLDSDNEDGCCRGSNRKDDDEKGSKYSTKFMNWKVPRFLRKTEGIIEAKKQEDCDKKSDIMPCVEQNGYQQLPVMIETPRPSYHTLDIPRATTSGLRPHNANATTDSNCSPSQCSMFDDIIDVRSYISQSRSDISPFARSGSYRSQCGRSPQGELTPVGRPRSSTLAPRQLDPNNTHNNNSQRHSCANPWGDGLSICPSATHSRKDSGIRSNSRRSSIQQAIYAMNQNAALSQQRVSGYFTSSQSSLSGVPEPVMEPKKPHPDPLAACLQQLRKQSDLQLIRCVKDNAKSQRSYLVKPPLSNITLFFKSRQMERDFRSKAHRFGSETASEGPPTLATPRYNTYIDIIIGVFIFITVSTSLFLLAPTIFNNPYRIWICLFATFSSIQFFALFICSKQMCRKTASSSSINNSNSSTSSNGKIGSCIDNLFDAISNWYPWHVCGGILMSLPVIAILTNLALLDVTKIQSFEYHYGFLLFICIIHFCNLTQLNCWLRNFLAMIAAIAFIGVAIWQLNALNDYQLNLNGPKPFHHLHHNPHHQQQQQQQQQQQNQQEEQLHHDSVAELKVRPAVLMHLNDTKYFTNNPNAITNNNNNNNGTEIKFQDLNSINNKNKTKRIHDNDDDHHRHNNEKNQNNPIRMKWLNYQLEMYLDLFLLLFLVWFLNREYEIGYRLTFYGSAVANQDKIRVQHMKNQADMLLHNIIPKHVADQLKNTAKYSENHKDVGIIFASIVNFNEMYDESYLGGKEYLRVLNELIGDFDELLTRPEFRCVEKIKTIGSTFMATSGLDPSNRGVDNYHLYALMDFACAMQSVVAAFNKDLLEFNLILRIGYNIGDVTAGVIGTSKLYYDIWGDAVNVASRMDTTGVPERIQVGKDCLPYLERMYEFEPRGKVYVKGKDHMEVYLLKGKKSNVPGDQHM